MIRVRIRAVRRAAALLVLAALPLGAQAQSPEELVGSAERAEKAGNFQQAADFYRKFLGENAVHVQRSLVCYRLAIALDNIGQTDQAIEQLQASVALPPDKTADKHRPDAYMRLAKLLADARKFDEAAATLEKLFKEGAGLYEDEAQNLRGGYLTILGKFDEAAILFNVLRNKPSSPFAKEAAYKLAVVWIKADNHEMAKSAIGEFAQRYPSDPRIVDLFMRLARAYYDKKNYKSASELCQQVINEFKDTPEAVEAAFMVALSYRDSGKLETAVDLLEKVAKMPRASQNSIVVSEALFEAAQICRKSLNNHKRAADLYQLAGDKARSGLTERQAQIQEQCLFYSAEYLFREEKWSAALDLYAQLRKLGSKINISGRIQYCQSKLSTTGDISMTGDSEEELKFLRQRIAENPKTLLALQSEIFLLDRKYDKLVSHQGKPRSDVAFATVQPLIEEYNALTRAYPLDVLNQEDLRAYIYMRMGSIYTLVGDNEPDKVAKLKLGIQLLMQALQTAPEALFRVEALETLAILANRAGEHQKAMETYQQLLKITGQTPAAGGNAAKTSSDYLEGLVATATTTNLAESAIADLRKIIADNPPESLEARDARFYLAELLYLQKRYSEAAKSYTEFIKVYGATQSVAAATAAAPKQAPAADLQDQVFEAGLRVAHCWRMQGHKTNMVAAYRYVVEKQNYGGNPRVAEAAYMALTGPVNVASLQPAQKEELGRNLWTQVVNASLDFGAKAFGEGYYRWIYDPNAMPFVRLALMKAAQLTAEGGNHRRAAAMYAQYVALYNPESKQLRDREGKPLLPNDEYYEMAFYAVGREYVQANDIKAMMDAFKPYSDGMRDSKFRCAALQLMGHYGTQAELYIDAADAYAALLDEYTADINTNDLSHLVPVKSDERLRRGSKWNGVRMRAPAKWDAGQVRFGLGFLYWRQEQWDLCARTLQPFVFDATLRTNASRAEALFMLARSKLRLVQEVSAREILQRLIKDHPDFKGIEEAYAILARSLVKGAEWNLVDRCVQEYAAKFPSGERLDYMNLCGALVQISKGQVEAGEKTLTDLSRAETFEDVKAEAYYRLGLRKLAATPPDGPAALALMRKSVGVFPVPYVLLDAARCALDVKDYQAARALVDQLLQEFPKEDRVLIDQAQQLRKKIMEMEAAGRR